jgi:hypothetical protein
MASAGMYIMPPYLPGLARLAGKQAFREARILDHALNRTDSPSARFRRVVGREHEPR